ncbi:ribulose-phosphate 3-epimerase [Ruminococcaceae bacterium OttesenSCG-928-I18]|nr:ribulose-phosphate 3-epimerase [Ruminococcaceae bacterium OttesenSCG-928-I18]
MVQVAPSILSANFARLEEDCKKVYSPDNPMLHFDVMDGVFVPNLSFGLPVLQSLSKAMPEAVYDVHLMIVQPGKYAEAFAEAGADMITFHVEAERDPTALARKIRTLGCKAGLSLRPGTSVEGLFPLLCEIDLVLVMSVEPGFGGQAFRPEATGRIAALRGEAERQNTPLLIEVDGGINEETGARCVQAGADILVAGSTVFGAENPKKMVEKLRNL